MRREIEFKIRVTIMFRDITITTDAKRLFTRFQYGFIQGACKGCISYRAGVKLTEPIWDGLTFVDKLITLRDEEDVHRKRLERRRCRGIQAKHKNSTCL